MSKALQPNDLIAHYRVVRALGAGGMGEVYLARDSTLDRNVALKVLPLMAQVDDRVRRFVLEAKSASSLNHPNIITVYEIGCEPVIAASGVLSERVNYIAMELVDGTVLSDIIHDAAHRIDLKALLGYLAQAADGLAKAHASGIVHRDLKPGNIMVTRDGYTKVLDFGLAKLVEPASAPDATIDIATKQALTMEGMIVGTIGYMAPEQILGRGVDHRADTFSFGCIPYEAVTRQRPLATSSQFEALNASVVASVAVPRDNVLTNPRWSPDGKHIAIVYTPESRRPSISVVGLESGQMTQVGNWGGPVIDSLSWMGNDGLVVAGAPSPGPTQLWYVSYPGGERRRLSSDISQYHFVSTSADGKFITARRTERAAEMWRIPLNGKAEQMERFTTAKQDLSGFGAAADGTMIFIAPQEDSVTLWSLKPPDTRTAIAPKGTAVLSHRFIRGQDATAFTAYGSDMVGHIHRVKVDGSEARELTKGTGEELLAVTPDGRFLLYTSTHAARTLLVLPSDGSGGPRQLATDLVGGLIFSRDGKLVSYNRLDTTRKEVVSVRTVLSFADGTPLATFPGRAAADFLPDGSGFTFVESAVSHGDGPPSPPAVYRMDPHGEHTAKLFEVPGAARIDVQRWADDHTMVVGAFSTTGVSNLWRWTTGAAKPTQLTDFRAGLLFEFAVSPDATTVYFTQGSLNRDIIKITGLK